MYPETEKTNIMRERNTGIYASKKKNQFSWSTSLDCM